MLKYVVKANNDNNDDFPSSLCIYGEKLMKKEFFFCEFFSEGIATYFLLKKLQFPSIKIIFVFHDKKRKKAYLYI